MPKIIINAREEILKEAKRQLLENVAYSRIGDLLHHQDNF